MDEKPVKVTARILGEDYTIRGRAPQEHIEKVAKYVDRRMQEIAEAYPKLGTSRVAVLAAINMADELFKLKEQYEQLTQLLEEEWSQRRTPAGAGTAAAGSRAAAGAGAATGSGAAHGAGAAIGSGTGQRDPVRPTADPMGAAAREVAATASPGSVPSGGGHPAAAAQIPAFGEPPSGEFPRPRQLFTGDALRTPPRAVPRPGEGGGPVSEEQGGWDPSPEDEDQ